LARDHSDALATLSLEPPSISTAGQRKVKRRVRRGREMKKGIVAKLPIPSCTLENLG
jgi:hypothetical protein